MILRMNREQMDELLLLCSENPLNVRKLYEGALILVWDFLSEMCPEWFDEKEPDGLERKEEILSQEYQDELKGGGPVDFQVLASRQVDKALKEADHTLKKELREMPGWYLSEKERKLRLKKRRLSTIFSEVQGQMILLRKRVNAEDYIYKIDETKIEINISDNLAVKLDYSLKRVLDHLSDDYGYQELSEVEDAEELRMVDEIDREWMDAVKNRDLLASEETEFETFCDRLFRKMNQYYKRTYHSGE